MHFPLMIKTARSTSRGRPAASLIPFAMVIVGVMICSCFHRTTFAKPPEWKQTFPTGVQQGSSVELTLTGSFEHWPPQINDMLGPESGLQFQFGKKGKMTVTAKQDAPTGIRWLRLTDPDGATSLRPLFVSGATELAEKEPNNEVDQAMAVTMPVVVSGKLEKSGEVDGFRVRVAKGDTLVASMRAHRWIGSPMDGVLQICDQRGFVLAQNDDERGLDPLIVWQSDRDGDVVVRTFAFPSKPNSSIRFSGAADYVYRLELTTGPYVDHALPLASNSGGTEYQCFGWNLPVVAKAKRIDSVELALGRHETFGLPDALGFAVFDHSPWPTHAVEKSEPAIIDVSIPTRIMGRLPTAAPHIFAIEVKAKQRLRMKADAIGLSFALDPILEVLELGDEPTGHRVLAESDDVARNNQDSALDWVAPKDGRYGVRIRDTHGRGGDRMVYQLSIAAPSFSLTTTSSQFVVEPDKPLEIKVAVARERGNSEPIEIAAEGLPDGVEAAAVQSEPKGDSAKSVTLKLTSDGKKLRQGAFRIVGKSATARTLARFAVPDSPQRIEAYWVTAKPKTKPDEKKEDATTTKAVDEEK